MDGGVGHTAFVPEGHEGRSQAGPKGRNLEVGARMAPRLLVYNIEYLFFFFFGARRCQFIEMVLSTRRPQASFILA